MLFSISSPLLRVLRLIWLGIVVPLLCAGAVSLIALTYDTLAAGLTAAVLFLCYGWYLLYRLQVSPAPDHQSEEIMLMQAKAQLEHLFEHSPVPYLRVSPAGKIREANLAAIRLFQSNVNEIVTLQFFSHVVIPTEEDLSMLHGKLRSGVSVTDIEAQIQTVANEWRWVRLSIYTPGINATEHLVTLVDITQQKKIDQAKSEFVALAAHQLRTPVVAIRWNLELLSGNPVLATDNSATTHVRKAARNAARMLSLIGDFLSVSKLETGTFEAEPGRFDFSAYLADVVDEFAGVIRQQKVTLSLEKPTEPAIINADRRLLHIVTSNLISNAIKYTPATGKITVAYQVSGSTVILRVRDTGIGIPAEDQTHLFSKFFRASNARTHQAEGTGLGLYIVKQSLEKMGGTIHVQSAVGEGTEFTASFPLTSVAPE